MVKILLSFLYSFSSVELSCKVLHWALCDKPHCPGGGLCVYVHMHTFIVNTNRTNGQLLSRCTPAQPNGDYSPQVLVKVARKWLRSHFLFPVFLLVRDILRVLLIVSCTGRDVRALPRHIAKQSYCCAQELRASLLCLFLMIPAWLKWTENNKQKLQRNRREISAELHFNC